MHPTPAHHQLQRHLRRPSRAGLLRPSCGGAFRKTNQEPEDATHGRGGGMGGGGSDRGSRRREQRLFLLLVVVARRVLLLLRLVESMVPSDWNPEVQSRIQRGLLLLEAFFRQYLQAAASAPTIHPSLVVCTRRREVPDHCCANGGCIHCPSAYVHHRIVLIIFQLDEPAGCGGSCAALRHRLSAPRGRQCQLQSLSAQPHCRGPRRPVHARQRRWAAAAPRCGPCCARRARP